MNITTPIKVLDKGYVKVIGTLPSIDLTNVEEGFKEVDLYVVNAARISFGKSSRNGDEKDWKLLKYLMDNKHTTPLEQVVIAAEVYAPMVVWWQWKRHRTWRYMTANFNSGRYVEFDNEEYYIPEFWRNQSKDNKQASEGISVHSDKMSQIYKESVGLMFEMYEKALSLGIAKEQARLFLPGWALYYKAIVNVDLKNLLDFINLRDHNHAQFEIREYAKVFSTIVQNIAPRVWEYK